MVGGGTVFENQVQSIGSLFQAERQNFSVGTMFHAEQQTILVQTAQAARPELHVKLRRIDRGPQIEQLAQILKQAQAPLRRKPLVVILQSRPEDEPLAFVQRLGEHGFAADLSLPCDYLGNFDWPERSIDRTVGQLIGAIYQARDEKLPSRPATPEGLTGLIANHGRSLAFAHVVKSTRCRPELLRDWESLIADKCPNPANGLLICFLCVQLRSSHDTGSGRIPSLLSWFQRRAAPQPPDWLAEELKLLSVRHKWPFVDSLAPIEPRHIEEWIDEYNLNPVLPELPRIESNVPTKVFNNCPNLRYREVMERLLRVLAPRLRPEQPRWTT